MRPLHRSPCPQRSRWASPSKVASPKLSSRSGSDSASRRSFMSLTRARIRAVTRGRGCYEVARLADEPRGAHEQRPEPRGLALPLLGGQPGLAVGPERVEVSVDSGGRRFPHDVACYCGAPTGRRRPAGRRPRHGTGQDTRDNGQVRRCVPGTARGRGKAAAGATRRGRAAGGPGRHASKASRARSRARATLLPRPTRRCEPAPARPRGRGQSSLMVTAASATGDDSMPSVARTRHTHRSPAAVALAGTCGVSPMVLLKTPSTSHW